MQHKRRYSYIDNFGVLLSQCFQSVFSEKLQHHVDTGQVTYPNEKSCSNIREQIDQHETIAVLVFDAKAVALFLNRLFFVSSNKGAI